jgi:hypothetical protein
MCRRDREATPVAAPASTLSSRGGISGDRCGRVSFNRIAAGYPIGRSTRCAHPPPVRSCAANSVRFLGRGAVIPGERQYCRNFAHFYLQKAGVGL